jgi:hypothetical protein
MDMKYKRLLFVLLGAFAISGILTLAAELLQGRPSTGQGFGDACRMVLALATLPGEFVAMTKKGMCNTHTPAAIAIKLMVNASFYFVPVLVLATIIDAHLRKKRLPSGTS